MNRYNVIIKYGNENNIEHKSITEGKVNKLFQEFMKEYKPFHFTIQKI